VRDEEREDARQRRGQTHTSHFFFFRRRRYQVRNALWVVGNIFFGKAESQAKLRTVSFVFSGLLGMAALYPTVWCGGVFSISSCFFFCVVVFSSSHLLSPPWSCLALLRVTHLLAPFPCHLRYEPGFYHCPQNHSPCSHRMAPMDGVGAFVGRKWW